MLLHRKFQKDFGFLLSVQQKSKVRKDVLLKEINDFQNKSVSLNQKWLDEKEKINTLQSVKLQIDENKIKLSITYFFS